MAVVSNRKVYKLWKDEIEKKLFRCSKELGVYNQIKKAIGTTNYPSVSIWKFKKFDILYCELLSSLEANEKLIINFERLGFNLEYPVATALKDERHFCHVLAFRIIMKADLRYDVSIKLIQEFSKEIFKSHSLHTNYVRIKEYIKRIFN